MPNRTQIVASAISDFETRLRGVVLEPAEAQRIFNIVAEASAGMPRSRTEEQAATIGDLIFKLRGYRLTDGERNLIRAAADAALDNTVKEEQRQTRLQAALQMVDALRSAVLGNSRCDEQLQNLWTYAIADWPLPVLRGPILGTHQVALLSPEHKGRFVVSETVSITNSARTLRFRHCNDEGLPMDWYWVIESIRVQGDETEVLKSIMFPRNQPT